jgi:acyl carrier protein
MGLAGRLGLATAGCDAVATTAPRTPLERRIAAIWAAVLGGDPPGIHANFFRSGGDSLKATQVLGRLSRELTIDFPLQSLFVAPTQPSWRSSPPGASRKPRRPRP